MAQEILDQTLTLEIPSDNRSQLSRSSSLNAAAPAFVPRPPPRAHQHRHVSRSPPATTVWVPVSASPSPVGPSPSPVEPSPSPAEPSPSPSPAAVSPISPDVGLIEQSPPVSGGGGVRGEVVNTVREGLSKELTQKIIKQVEYYFSDLNLATTQHLMRLITNNPDGYVPMTVIASFKRIKDLVSDSSLLVDALRKSSQLVVTDNGKRVRRRLPFTESDVEELQLRTIVADDLPDDHSYYSLKKIFSGVGRVKNIRTCYPQTSTSGASSTNFSFCNKAHAFVEYATLEDAESAISECNEEGRWKSGLRVRRFGKCMEEDGGNDREGNRSIPGRGRGRGGRGRGHNSYQNNSYHRNGGHVVGTPSSAQPVHKGPALVTKQPPGPSMPDGTRGFTMGRGKPIAPISAG